MKNLFLSIFCAVAGHDTWKTGVRIAEEKSKMHPASGFSVSGAPNSKTTVRIYFVECSLCGKEKIVKKEYLSENI